MDWGKSSQLNKTPGRALWKQADYKSGTSPVINKPTIAEQSSAQVPECKTTFTYTGTGTQLVFISTIKYGLLLVYPYTRDDCFVDIDFYKDKDCIADIYYIEIRIILQI